MISGVGAVCRETRKANFSRQEWTYSVHDWREKCGLTWYHGKLTHDNFCDKDAAMSEHEKFNAQMEEQLKAMKAKLDDAKTTAETKGRDFFARYEKDLAKLESKYDLARYKLTLLRKGGQSAWGEVKSGFERAYHDLREALNKASNKF